MTTTSPTAPTLEPPAAAQVDPDSHAVPPFEERYEAALHHPRVARNITGFQQRWRQSRSAAMAETDFPALRAKLKAAKQRVLDDHDRYLAQFQAAAERVGATIHHAVDAAEANALAIEIAKRHGADLIAKSKSMVSEEIGLNHACADAGITVVETDLGEWIVQLKGERPSHIVGPALHLSRGEIAELFAEKLGRPFAPDDIGGLVRAARAEIRKAFFAAGIGMTGANALIAETGTIMMCTNEGNGRLASSVPPVQIVLAGIEKLVPTWEDAITQLRLLGRSATGQRLTSYTTFITGPTPGHELHIILVDNGRRQMAAKPEFREALACIRCGACSNVCPPYREVGGHVFGYIYTGAIGLIVTPFHHGLDAAAKPQSLCLSCNACETVCPAGIPLPRQIIDVRKMVVAAKGLPRAKGVVLAAYARPRTFDLLTRIGARAQTPLTRGGRFVRARRVPILRKQTRWRSLPALARRPLRDRVAPGIIPAGPPALPNGAAGLTVALFPGCLTDRLYPEQGEAIARTLRALGCRLVMPAGLHCCGLPANNSGDDRHARWMARQTIRALEPALRGADWIVSGSASCVATLAQDYEHLFRDDRRWLASARAIAPKVTSFTEFLVRVADLPAGSLAAPDGGKPAVTYHDSCQGLNALGLSSEPRRILVELLGCDLRELAENTLCCGFGGTFSFEYPAVAERLQRRKLDNAEATGAPLLVTDNQGCIMHLRGGCDAQGRPLRVVHIAELVAERLRSLDRGAAGTAG